MTEVTRAPIRNGTKVILKASDESDLLALALSDEDRNGGILLGIAPPVRKTPFIVVYVIVNDARLALVDPARWDDAVREMQAEAAVGASGGAGAAAVTATIKT